jgi:hypothetical protein
MAMNFVRGSSIKGLMDVLRSRVISFGRCWGECKE